MITEILSTYLYLLSQMLFVSEQNVSKYSSFIIIIIIKFLVLLIIFFQNFVGFNCTHTVYICVCVESSGNIIRGMLGNARFSEVQTPHINLTTTTTTTTWSRVLLEKLSSSQIIKEFPVFYGPWMFITAYSTARHPSLFWDGSIHSMHPIQPPGDAF
jgi:hypothetical protein